MISIDLFAGGGGASEGIETATGEPVAVAINHDPHAIQVHSDNHPRTIHLCESIHDVDPAATVANLCRGPLDLLWASPSCTHFSRARGSVPVSKQLRGHGWMIPRWAARTDPRLIIAENVAEWRTWGPVRRGFPVASRAGDYWRMMLDHLRRLGYQVDDRVLCAADYGAPTTRRRLFLVARRDGAPVWPELTHGPGLALPYRTAADCIDWSDLGTSIFERSRPLADATCRRIATGIARFVLGGRPFIIEIDNRSNGTRAVRSSADPLSTVTTENRHALVSAFLAKHYSGVIGQPCDRPLGTVTAVDHHSLVAASLTMLRRNADGRTVELPLPTVTAGGQHHALCAAFLTSYYSSGGTASDVGAPVPAIVAKARHGLVTVDIDGTTYALTDIRLRMLKPRELARAMGFPDTYITRGTTAQQIARIGNAVCPPVAEAIVRANAE